MRVGVLGATGRMGLAVCAAVLDAPDLELAAAVARSTGVGRPLRELVPGAPAQLLVGEHLSDLLAAEDDLLVGDQPGQADRVDPDPVDRAAPP
ncbi:MAG TPA: hypothetical protein VHS79_23480, partial [Actinomycetes bacterium]|nr:hypothetical protein [Actinomycetes bacterium]